MTNVCMRVGVLTVSDTCSRGEAEDRSGPLLAELAGGLGSVVRRDCVPDTIEDIRRILVSWADSGDVDLILSTGGTGFSLRDVTPEAVLSVLDRQAPGITQAMMAGSLAVTPLAALARPVAGIRGKTVVVTLPGSCKAVAECFSFIEPVLAHAVDQLTGRKKQVTAVHQKLQEEGAVVLPRSRVHQHVCPHHVGPSPRGGAGVAARARVSPYPMISVEDAQKAVLAQCDLLLRKDPGGCGMVVVGTEQVEYAGALGRILCQAVSAVDPLPPFPASIKDGYAVVSSDGPGIRTVRGASSAGDTPDFSPLRPGEVVRINTGAPVPPGADAVVMVEDTKLISANSDGEEVTVEILSTPYPGLDIRPVGSDIEAGETVLSAGTVLGAAEVGVLAAVGAISVTVSRLPRVAVLSTGNEIQEPGESLLPGHIRDSNRMTLLSLLREQGFPATDAGIAKDDESNLTSALKTSLEECDLLVTTGGVSMGDRDLLRQVLVAEFGAEIHFGRVNMKPGKPTTLATCVLNSKRKIILGLPGNPVSATVTCHLYVLPACRYLTGQRNPFPAKLRSKLKLAGNLYLDPRPEYLRVVLKFVAGQAVAEAEPTGNQISSRLTSMARANGLLILPAKSPHLQEIKPGSDMEFDVLIIGPLFA